MKQVIKTVASFFGVGFLPLMPGTWASLVTIFICWFLPGDLLYWALGLSVAGFLVCAPSEQVFSSKDPKAFVMDEVCGMMLTVLWLPKDIYLYIAAFFLFRILDVVKPWPISRIQKSTHPSSIMWDDLAAGVAGNIFLRFVFIWMFKA